VYTPLIGARSTVGAASSSRRSRRSRGDASILGLVLGAFALSRLVPRRLAGVEGAAWGFVVGALLVLLTALPWSAPGTPGRRASVRQHLAFMRRSSWGNSC
jgi:hypothetical protein